MPTVSISEAARLVGRNRKTIQRYVADGRLSISQDVHAGRGIDTSELVRVFGRLSRPSDATDDVGDGQRVAELEAKIKELEQDVTSRDMLLEARDRHIASLDAAMRLLEGTKKRRWWQIF